MTPTTSRILPGAWQGPIKRNNMIGKTNSTTLSSNTRQGSKAPAGGSALEQLPHLSKQVCLLWGEREFEVYANQLIIDSRNGKRQGLPWEAAQELLFLVELSIAKRALVASRVTGRPFKEMFSQCRATSGYAISGVADAWTEACANKETRNTERERAHAKAALRAGGNQEMKQKSWWSRLFG